MAWYRWAISLVDSATLWPQSVPPAKLKLQPGVGDGDQPAARFSRLESLRELGHVHLVQYGEQDFTSRRHLQAVAAYWKQAGDDIRAYFAHHLACTLQLRAEPGANRQHHIQRMQALEPPDWNATLTRYGRATQAYERRLQGDHQAYLTYSRQELAWRKGLDVQWESWAAAHALMRAEQDMAQATAALAVGHELLADIRPAGRLRKNAMRVGLHRVMLAQSGDVAATRQALPGAVALLSRAGASALLQPALGWLALHEGRHPAAARLLGCSDAPGRAGSHYGPGTYNRRTIEAPCQRLQQQLEPAEFARQRQLGGDLGDEGAIRLGLTVEDVAD